MWSCELQSSLELGLISHPTLTSTVAMSNDLQVPVLTLELGRDLHLVYLRELSIAADVKEYCPVIIITC